VPAGQLTRVPAQWTTSLGVASAQRLLEGNLGVGADEASGEEEEGEAAAAAAAASSPHRPRRRERERECRREGRRLQSGESATTAAAPAAVPGDEGPEELGDVGGSGGPGRTTVMIRNLPNNYRRAMVLALLNEEGFSGLFDFLYLPVDFNSQACLGYAFVNLVRPEVVPVFWKKFDGFSKWVLPSRKICGMSWSGPHQGLAAHIERYRNSPVMHRTVPEEFQPVLFANGVRIPFPQPQKAPRAPRIRNLTEGHNPPKHSGRGGQGGTR